MLIEPSQLGDWLSMAAAKCRQRIEIHGVFGSLFWTIWREGERWQFWLWELKMIQPFWWMSSLIIMGCVMDWHGPGRRMMRSASTWKIFMRELYRANVWRMFRCFLCRSGTAAGVWPDGTGKRKSESGYLGRHCSLKGISGQMSGMSGCLRMKIERQHLQRISEKDIMRLWRKMMPVINRFWKRWTTAVDEMPCWGMIVWISFCRALYGMAIRPA